MSLPDSTLPDPIPGVGRCGHPRQGTACRRALPPDRRGSRRRSAAQDRRHIQALSPLWARHHRPGHHQEGPAGRVHGGGPRRFHHALVGTGHLSAPHRRLAGSHLRRESVLLRLGWWDSQGARSGFLSAMLGTMNKAQNRRVGKGAWHNGRTNKWSIVAPCPRVLDALGARGHGALSDDRVCFEFTACAS